MYSRNCSIVIGSEFGLISFTLALDRNHIFFKNGIAGTQCLQFGQHLFVGSASSTLLDKLHCLVFEFTAARAEIFSSLPSIAASCSTV